MTALLRTSKADLNYCSITESSVLWYAGTPAAAEGPLVYPLTFLPPTPKNWDSSLKLSGAKGVRLAGVRAEQCRENVLDINYSKDCILEGQWGYGGGIGNQTITIKGGSHNISIKGTIGSDGERATVVVGAWSDQSTATTHDLDLSLLRHSTGRSITVILGRVNSPLRSILFRRSPDILLPSNARIKIWASLGDLIYWHTKRLYVAIRTRRWNW